VSIYLVQGKLGNGKTLGAVSRIRDYLRAGRRVATNLDLRVERLLPFRNQSCRAIRLPDKPTAGDLSSLGLGCSQLDEEQYGLLVLDELGSWLNSREWNDPSRKALVDWLIHSRKHRWDVMFIVQDAGMIDKQIREALMEYLVTCRRMDKIPIPFFGTFFRLVSFGAWCPRLPRFHTAVVRYSGGATITSDNSIVVDRWVYRGHDLYAAYDTEQVFSASYSDGVYSYLPPWQVHGRYLPPSWFQRVFNGVWRWWHRPRPALVPSARLAGLRALPAEARWRVARRLVQSGAL